MAFGKLVEHTNMEGLSYDILAFGGFICTNVRQTERTCKKICRNFFRRPPKRRVLCARPLSRSGPPLRRTDRHTKTPPLRSGVFTSRDTGYGSSVLPDTTATHVTEGTAASAHIPINAIRLLFHLGTIIERIAFLFRVSTSRTGNIRSKEKTTLNIPIQKQCPV